MSKIKADVISGFLGAGKTTLLAKYAAYRIRQGEKIAVIENEFGEIGIDGLILKSEGLTVHEIVNGCICCSLKEDIITTLEKLASEKVSRVLIEPTGIFMLNEIYPILAAPTVCPFYETGAIITVVDAKNYLKQKGRYAWFFNNQIQWAHRLVLSKTGLIDEDTVLKTIQSLQSTLDSIDIEAGDWNTFSDDDWERIFTSCASKTEDSNDNKGSFKTYHRHGSFRGISIHSDHRFNENMLVSVAKMLSSGSFGDIPRAKGTVASETNGSFEFDYVDGDMHIRYKSEPAEKTNVSFIGSGLQKSELSQLFNETSTVLNP